MTRPRPLFLVGVLAGVALVPAACAVRSDPDPSASGTAALAPTGTDPPDPTVTPPPPPPPSFESLMAKYASFDINGDGTKEITSLGYALTDNTPPATSPRGMAIVFVDPRYLVDDPRSTVSTTLIKLWLALYRADLMADGYDPRFVAAGIERTPTRHQDGRDLMALRRFLKDVRASYPLRQVLFIGDFPEASILRSTLIRASYSGTMHNNTQCIDCDALFSSSELTAARTELPLADLDGNWEALYVEKLALTDVVLVPPATTGTWPAPGGVYISKAYAKFDRSYEDVFWVRDSDTGFWEYGSDGRLTVSRVDDRNPELAPNDVGLANPIARPELQVSRINPRHVAVQPFTSPAPGVWESALDPDGFPNSVPAYGLTDVIWNPDGDLERRLLVEFMQRAHAFRSGSDRALPFRAASIRSAAAMDIAHSPSWMSGTLGTAATFGSSYDVDSAELDEYVSWLRQPGVFRGIVTHSDAKNSIFGGPVASSTLQNVIGSPAFTWTRREGVIPMLVPTYDVYGSQGEFVGTTSASMRLHRAIWASHALANAGQRFYAPFGCEVNSPAGFATQPYWSTTYAPEQNAEAMLFFANGLGVMSRAKLFNDYPPSSAFAAIKSAGNFGAGLPAYFAADAASSSLDSRTPPGGPIIGSERCSGSGRTRGA